MNKGFIEKEIESFANLPTGWDCGSGVKISDLVIKRSIEAYNLLKPKFKKSSLLETDVTPNSNNSITIDFSLLNDRFITLIMTENTYSFSYEQGLGKDFDTIYELNEVSDLKIIEKEFNIILDIKN